MKKLSRTQYFWLGVAARLPAGKGVVAVGFTGFERLNWERTMKKLCDLGLMQLSQAHKYVDTYVITDAGLKALDEEERR